MIICLGQIICTRGRRRPDTQVQNLFTSFTGGIPLAFGRAERHTLLIHQLPADRSAIHHYNVARVRATRPAVIKHTRIEISGKICVQPVP